MRKARSCTCAPQAEKSCRCAVLGSSSSILVACVCMTQQTLTSFETHRKHIRASTRQQTVAKQRASLNAARPQLEVSREAEALNTHSVLPQQVLR